MALVGMRWKLQKDLSCAWMQGNLSVERSRCLRVDLSPRVRSPDDWIVARKVAPHAEEVDALDTAAGGGAEVEDADAVLGRLDLSEE